MLNIRLVKHSVYECDYAKVYMGGAFIGWLTESTGFGGFRWTPHNRAGGFNLPAASWGVAVRQAYQLAFNPARNEAANYIAMHNSYPG